MSEPPAGSPQSPVDPTVVKAEHDAAAEAAEEVAGVEAAETVEAAAPPAGEGAGHESGQDSAGHDGEHGHAEHGHGGEALGPIEWSQWAAGLVGVAAGAIVAVAFALSTGYITV